MNDLDCTELTPISVSALEGDVLLPYTMPQAEYMYGCACTATGMLLGYYDKYGYLGYDVSNIIDGDIAVYSRGLDGNKYDMDAFDTVLGNFIANQNYVDLFYDTTPEQELQYTLKQDDSLNTDVYDCLASWLGTGQYWRYNKDFSTTYCFTSLEYLLNTSETITIDDLTMPIKFVDFKYGLYEYLATVGYTLDAALTASTLVDVAGGEFTFEDYMAEIDAGRPVLISITGHQMVGYGYNETTREIIFDDTYDADQRMVWDGTYNYANDDRSLTTIHTIVFDTTGLQKIQHPEMAAYEETGTLTFGMGNLSVFTFNNGSFSAGYVCCIGGMTTADWTATGDAVKPYIFVHNKLTDAEKTDTTDVDDLWCGEMTETNMLEITGHLNRCGWQSGDEFMSFCISTGETWAETRPLSKIFDNIDDSWQVKWGSFDRTGAKNTWLQQADEQLRSGNYIGWFQVKWGTPDNITGSHAMTLLGFTYDTSYSPDDPRYYSGVILLDSDDSKRGFDNAKDAPNLMKVLPVTWDDEIENYWFDWSADSRGFLQNVWTIRKMDTPDAADLTWHQPNAWNSPMTVNTRENAGCDKAILRTNEELLLNFAITNTGLAEAEDFCVNLLVDGMLQETFVVSSLAYGGIAAVQDFSLGTLSSGTHVISAVIDATGAVAEDYEANNIYSKTIEVLGESQRAQVSAGAGFVVSDGETASGFDVLSGGRVHVRGENAVATDATLNAGGTMLVSSGALLSSATVNGGELIVHYGARTSNVIVNGSRMKISGGTSIDDTIRANGSQNVYSGGLASRTVVSSGGRLWLGGGVASDCIISNGGREIVDLYDETPSHDYNALVIGGTQTVYQSGAQAHSATLRSGGVQYVYSGGMAYDTIVSSGCRQVVYSNGVAHDALLSAGGSQYLSSGGTAISTIVSSGGSLIVGPLGSAWDAAVSSGGILRMTNQGVLSNAIVSSGAFLNVSSGAVLQGSIQVAGSMTVAGATNAADADILLDLTQRITTNPSIISNYANLGETSLSVQLSPEMTTGVYKLASNASSFNKTVTVHCEDEDDVEIQLNTLAHIGDFSLRLGISSSTLQLTIAAADKVAPVISNLTANYTTPTKNNVTITATFSDNVSVTQKQYRIGDTGDWLAYTNGALVTDNAVVYFRAFDAEGNIGEASYTVSNIDRTPPATPIPQADKTAITNENVTVTVTLDPDVVNCQYSKDNGSWTTYTSAGVVCSANCTLRFRATDEAGNISDISQYVVSNIDKTLPTIANISASITTPTNGNVLVTANFADNVELASSLYKIGDGEWTQYDGGVLMTDNGTITFMATDTAGNSKSASHTVSNIDRIAPDAPIASANVTSATNSDVIVAATFSGDSFVRQYSMNGGKWQSYTAPLTFTENGTVSFRAWDEAGNLSEETMLTIDYIDKQPPQNPIVSLDFTRGASPSVVLSATFENDSAQRLYSLNGGEWLAYTDELTFTEDGQIVFKAMDMAGNAATTAYTWLFEPEELPLLDLEINPPQASGIALVSATANTELSVFQYSLDGSDWLDVDNGLIQLQGNGSLQFKMIDTAGNAILTKGYQLEPFNVLLSELQITGIENSATVNWSIDSTAQWATDYSARIEANGMAEQFDGLAGDGIELISASETDIALSLKPAQSQVWTNLEQPIYISGTGLEANILQASTNDMTDIMFATANSTWNNEFQARHTGYGNWTGTRDAIALAGKNRMTDFFLGSDDASILLLTDDENGDALFVDDIYSALPGQLSQQQARLAKIDEIRAGAGDDVVDMTSQRFEYVGNGLIIKGGDGNDVIWANSGSNTLFGEEGDDRIVGGGGNDLIIGGFGNDTMNGGGGNDTFCFCEDWGQDTITQLEGGSVTLWFANGSIDKWNVNTLTYTDGDNSLTVIGLAASDITLMFEDDDREQYAILQNAGAFC